MSLKIQRVLASDPVHQNCIDILEKFGISVTHGVKLTPQQLCQQIKDYDGLIVRSETKVTKEVLEAGAGRLKLVGRAGTGVDNIDVPVATQLGIYVLNTPGGNSLSACELTCALISSVARNVGAGVVSMKQGKWDRKSLMGTELNGKTLGVIGLGRIGREVAHRMKSYGMSVVGFDPLVTQDQAKDMGIHLFMNLDQLWPLCDYITLHVPLNQHTKDLLNQTTLSKCKKGVKIINVARGGIVNEKDLLAALNSGQCGGAGLDVYSEEPPKSQHIWDLVKHPLVTGTPHLGASTQEAQVRVAEEIAQQFVALAVPNSGYKVDGSVNSDVLSALSNFSNSGLVTLSRGVGSLASSLVYLTDSPSIEVHTQSGGPECRWVSSCIVEGMMNKTGPGCLSEAKSLGLKDIVYKHNGQSTCRSTDVCLTIALSTGRLQLKGSCDESTARLVTVNDTPLVPAFSLSEQSKFIRTSNVGKTLQQIFSGDKSVGSVAVVRLPQETLVCTS